MSLAPTLIAPWLTGSERKPLPRFFFDVQDGFVSPDVTGTELPSVDHARMEAVKSASVHLSQEPELMCDGRELRVLVLDETAVLRSKHAQADLREAIRPAAF